MKRLLFSTCLFFAPGASYACSVCGFGQDGTQEAFLITTGIMTGIPLIALVGVLYLISRRRPHDDQQD
jgi:hypothetical protein